MERADILGGIAASGTDTTARRVTERAAELDIPVADLLAVAGHPVPADLLPPERDAEIPGSTAQGPPFGGMKGACEASA
ncbi:hypothetical protein, partial [Streptomyces zhihengii]